MSLSFFLILPLFSSFKARTDAMKLLIKAIASVHFWNWPTCQWNECGMRSWDTFFFTYFWSFRTSTDVRKLLIRAIVFIFKIGLDILITVCFYIYIYIYIYKHPKKLLFYSKKKKKEREMEKATKTKRKFKQLTNSNIEVTLIIGRCVLGANCHV